MFLNVVAVRTTNINIIRTIYSLYNDKYIIKEMIKMETNEYDSCYKNTLISLMNGTRDGIVGGIETVLAFPTVVREMSDITDNFGSGITYVIGRTRQLEQHYFNDVIHSAESGSKEFNQKMNNCGATMGYVPGYFLAKDRAETHNLMSALTTVIVTLGISAYLITNPILLAIPITTNVLSEAYEKLRKHRRIN